MICPLHRIAGNIGRRAAGRPRYSRRARVITSSPPTPLNGLIKSACLLLVPLFAIASTQAETLFVGPNHDLKAPSAAARAARDGDKVEIDPGEYFDCAIWTASDLTIMGNGPGVVITDRTCEGKALFVIRGNDVTIRNITFARARVPDGNGAGIRVEGRNLSVEHSRFINNENGILAGANLQSSIRVSESEFARNVGCDMDIGQIAGLKIKRSKFSGNKSACQIKSYALSSELVDNDIDRGSGETSGYLIDVAGGGSLIMESNVLQVGPGARTPRIAIMLGGDKASNEASVLRISSNAFRNDSGRRMTFIVNWTDASPVLENNHFFGDVTPVSSEGYWQHRARRGLASTKDAVSRLIDLAKRGLRRLTNP